jgi:NAD-dependent DNA ligase
MDALRNNLATALKGYTKAKKNADELAALLEEANEAYRNTNAPLLSDDIYDIAEDHLRKIAPKHPFLQRVGALEHGDKVKLPYWMGSLDKIKDDGEKAIAKFTKAYPGSYVVSHKLDGNSGMLVYSPGQPTRLYSRGDGKEGQDLTGMLRYVKLPHNAVGEKENVAVRGELIISRQNWSAIADKGANARNVVAGAMHAKHPDPDIAKRIDFVAYELLHPKMPFGEGLTYLERAGFNVVWHDDVDDDNLTVENLSKILVREREDAEYEIDGIVLMHDDVHKQPSGKNPKYAFAFKSILTQEEAEVTVSGVEWRISKDGAIKPTVVFPAVSLGGATIQRATGNNAAFIEKNKIGVGARIVIIRSGDVIPKIIRVTRPAPGGHSMPEIPFEWNSTHVDVMVVNDKDKDNGVMSAEQKLRNLEHFAKTLSIKHVAVGTLKKLADAGHDSVAALLKLSVEDVAGLEGFQTTSATNVVAGLQKTKRDATCMEWMVASNIFGRGLGSRKIAAITRELPQILAGTTPTLAELTQIEGVGEATANAFLAGLSAFHQFMRDIGVPCRATGMAAADAAGPSQNRDKKDKKPNKKAVAAFAGAVLVFTGFRNKEWEQAVEAAGGKVSSAISGKTTLVVAADPDESSTKLNKARDLGIKIISKQEFSGMLA